MPSDSFKSVVDLCGCQTQDINRESEFFEKLKDILAADPDVSRETDESGRTLLHRAAESRSVDFCKLLIEQYPEALMVTDNGGCMPFHYACAWNNVETAKHLFQLYPGCIDTANSDGEYPIHYICLSGEYGRDKSDLIQFLLDHDRGAVTKPKNTGLLPLHLAVLWAKSLNIVKLLFNAYPEAIFIDVGMFGDPLGYVRRQKQAELASFFESQLNFVRQAKEDTIQDGNGMPPIHRFLPNRDLSLGAVKLMIMAYPVSVNVANNLGRIPLHIAVNRGDIGIVKYFIKTNAESLTVFDSGGNCALHHACLAGKSDIINCILEISSHGSSVRNAEGKLPIQLLMENDEINQYTLEYMGAIHSLLKAHPNLRDIAA